MKRVFLFLFLLSSFVGSQAAGFPQVSTGTQEYWYYLKFTQGTFVVSSNGEGSVCKALIPMNKDNQLWKVEGTDQSGYTFTNKLGLRLYLTGTSQGSEVRAGATPPSLSLFKISANGSNYIITPSTNTGQAFNVWGGMGLRNDIKLYNSSDANAPIQFLSPEEIGLKNTAINVVPYPASVIMQEGVLNLRLLASITYFSDSTALLAHRLADDLQRTAGIELAVKESATGNVCSMVRDASFAREAYKLSITTSGIEVRASAFAGFFNALQTLRQLMPAAIFGQEKKPDVAWEVPCLVIEDEPAMQHRGFHLDISRHFFDKEEVKKLLDMASVYKLNRFHWHLTDDQGWRIEIPEYPLLTTIGAIRKASLTVCDQSGYRFFDDTEYGRGCFYTLDDLREVVAYARERNIEIIPEIDMPGHMTACIVAYPELGCNPEKKIEVMIEGGISRDILNIGKDETMDFLKCVIGHVAEVFPYELIHLGGDECPTTAWQTNADCQRRITEEGLSGVDDLQAWLVEQLGKFLREGYGKNVVVWDELLAHWNNNYTTKPIVMSWRGVDYAAQAADRGLHSIMVPTNPLYFDYMQVHRDQLEIDCPYNCPYGTINSIERVYNFDPRSTVSGREQYVLGTQANLWTESCTSNREAEYQYYPRLLALSEIAWLPTAKKDFCGFYSRLQHQADVLEAKQITYAPHYFEPKELTAAEKAIAEAKDILSQSKPGAVGYPEVAEAEALQQALSNLQNNPSDANLTSLQQQIRAYKQAAIVLPEAGRLYKIVSASTYFRNRFNGSSLYVKDASLALHYTQQAEPEEVWQFVPQENGTYKVMSALTGNALTIPSTNGEEVSINTPLGSNITIAKATKASGEFTYIPGVVNIKTGSYCLYAQLSGRDLTFTASTDGALCYPGTWRIEEVTDYRQWLERLVEKMERIYEENDTEDASVIAKEKNRFLADEVIAPAKERLTLDEVSRQDYLDIVALYQQYIERSINALDLIDPSYYYLIHNVHFTKYYAAANPNTNGILPKSLTTDDTFRWYFVVNEDGTVNIFNKRTNTAAYVASSTEEQRVKVGKNYDWKLQIVTTDEGTTAVGILDASKKYSWHINPQAWTYVLLKPYTAGASVWEFEKTDEEVPTGIESITNLQGTIQGGEAVYDLTGRRMPTSLHTSLPKGVYIWKGRKVCL